MSPEVFRAMTETRAFLFERVYLGRVGDATRQEVERILLTLLEYHAKNPAPGGGEIDPRVVAVDYVAGMTDRFAIRAFEDIVGTPSPSLGLSYD
jgi:dGTPase